MDEIAFVEASITEQNSFSDPVKLFGEFHLVLSGTWSATVTVQLSFNGSDWFDVDTYTANTVLIGIAPEQGVWYRFGVKTGDFTSDQVDGRLSQ